MNKAAFCPSFPLLQGRRAFCAARCQGLSLSVRSAPSLRRPGATTLCTRDRNAESATHWSKEAIDGLSRKKEEKLSQPHANERRRNFESATSQSGEYFSTREPRDVKRESRQLKQDVYSSDENFKSESQSSENVTSTYLQCPECRAMYVVEIEEVQGDSRIVHCSSCQHEWLASEKHLLWGEEAATFALRYQRSSTGNAKDNSLLHKDHSQKELLTHAPSQWTPPERYQQTSWREAASSPGQERNSSADKKRDANIHKRPIKRARTRTPSEPVSIFVGNLSFQASPEALMDLFRKYGRVTSCNIPSNATGLSRGFGFVGMANSDEAKVAVRELQGHIYFGRAITVQQAVRRNASNSFPKGTRPNITKEDVKQHVEEGNTNPNLTDASKSTQGREGVEGPCSIATNSNSDGKRWPSRKQKSENEIGLRLRSRLKRRISRSKKQRTIPHLGK